MALVKDFNIFQKRSDGTILTFAVHLDDRIGVGAEGDVYRGTINEKPRAIKIVKQFAAMPTDQLVKKLIMEHIHSSKLSQCENVMKIMSLIVPKTVYENPIYSKFQNHAFFLYHETGNEIYVSNELISGQSLHSIIQLSKTNGKYEYDVKTTFINIVQAVRCMHDQNVVHRDLKPLNIMFDNNNVKIIDFGNMCMTDMCVFKGSGFTGEYAPTEQMNFSDASLSPRYSQIVMTNKQLFKKYDIFSLGCTLFQMLTMRFLFAGIFGSLTWDRTMKSLRWPKIPKHHPQYEWIRLIIHMIMPDPRKRVELNDDLIARISGLPEPDYLIFTQGIPVVNPNNINVGQWVAQKENEFAGGTRRQRRNRRRRNTYRRRR